MYVRGNLSRKFAQLLRINAFATLVGPIFSPESVRQSGEVENSFTDSTFAPPSKVIFRLDNGPVNWR